jgi:hypothetical protein
MAPIYKRLLQLGKVAGVITFLFGIPYGLWQYLDLRHEKRVEQSLALHNLFNSTSFLASRAKITRALTKHWSEIDPLFDPYDASKIASTLERVLAAEDAEADVHLVIDFFDGVSSCVNAALCDSNTALDLFKRLAIQQYTIFDEYIKLQRKKVAQPGFGLGVEKIATSEKTNRWFFCCRTNRKPGTSAP